MGNGQGKGLRISGRTVASLLLLVLLLVLPFILPKYNLYLLTILGVLTVICTGQNLLMGYTGLVSIGQSAFVALSAYGATILAVKLGVPMLLSLPVGVLLSTALAALVALPILRLKELYLAIVTVALAEIVRTAIERGGNVTGAHDGLVVPALDLGVATTFDRSAMYYVVLVVTALMVLAARNIVRSAVGRAFMAVRDSERAAAALGIAVARYKTLSFTIAGFYAAVGGSLFALVMRSISPLDFTVWQSVDYLLIAVVGGMGTLAGPLLGSALFLVLREGLRSFLGAQEMVYGVLLLVTVLYLPEGLGPPVMQAFSAGLRYLARWGKRLTARTGRATAQPTEPVEGG